MSKIVETLAGRRCGQRAGALHVTCHGTADRCYGPPPWPVSWETRLYAYAPRFVNQCDPHCMHRTLPINYIICSDMHAVPPRALTSAPDHPPIHHTITPPTLLTGSCVQSVHQMRVIDMSSCIVPVRKNAHFRLSLCTICSAHARCWHHPTSSCAAAQTNLSYSDSDSSILLSNPIYKQ